MARLIDADKWAQYYSEERNRTPVANGYEDGQNDALDRVDTWLEEQPTIEATPVVHGRWIELPSMAPEYQCSECGQSYEWWEVSEAHYCPNCGAKMDGGVSDG